jgi:uncharacterized iron-regulated protein
MKKVLTFVFVALATLAMAQVSPKKAAKNQSKKTVEIKDYTCDNPAFIIYNNQGEKVTYAQMVEDLSNADVCLFGEQHNDPISHWMELNLIKSFYNIKKNNLVVGAEMWEADNQLIMDEMMVSKLVDGGSYAESSVLWPNFTTDYKPLLVFAKKNRIPFVCTNVPRRYARIVFKKGIEYLDSLSDQAKTYLPVLPIHFDLTQPIYAKMAAAFPSDEQFELDQIANKKSAGAMNGSKPSNLVKAQAIKDATMATFILKNWTPGKFFYHFNGEFHSANFSSIMYYLNYYNPSMNVKTISVNRQDEVFPLLEENKRATYNIIVPEEMTVTYIAKPI